MNAFATIVLLGWIPFGLLAFALLRPTLAMLVVVVGGFCLLPNHSIDISGFILVRKPESISLALLLGMIVFDSQRLWQFRLRWFDVFVLANIVSAPLASLANGHGVYDAVSASTYRVIGLGVPYFAGVLYLRTQAGLRDALFAVFVGGLAYVPLCLFEVRFSPQLHRLVYGQAQHDFVQAIRGGGYRPMVFLEHGLELALWMAVASLAGFVLWLRGGVRRLSGVPMGWLVAAVVVTFLLTKSAGALLLGAIGSVLLVPQVGPLAMRCALVAIPAYIVLRILGIEWVEDSFVEWSRWISADRSASLEYRLDNERLLLARFWERPWFGASARGFNIAAIADSDEVRRVVADSLWIILLSTNGLFGLVGMYGLFWLPVWRSLRAQWLGAADRAVVTGVGALLAMTMANGLFNGFMCPLYPAIAAGLLHAMTDEPRPAPARQPAMTSHDRDPAAPGRSDLPMPVPGSDMVGVLRPRRKVPGSWLRPRARR